MRGWFGRLIEIVAVAAAVSLPASLWASTAAAQTPAPVAHTTDLWAAASLGFGILGNGSSLAGQLALSRAVDRMVITIRGAGTAQFSETITDRGHGDVALLVGRRIASPQIPKPGNVGGTTASISLGLAGLYFEQPSTVSSPESRGVVPAIAFDADLMAHLRVIGVGVSLFGSSGTKERYLGAGLTLALGKIR